MGEIVKVTVDGETKEYRKGTPYSIIAKDFEDKYEYDIVLCLVDGRLEEMFKYVRRDCNIKFITVADTVGGETYRRSLIFLFLRVLSEIKGNNFVNNVYLRCSIDNGYYFEHKEKKEITKEELALIKDKMQSMVNKDYMFIKRSLNVGDVIADFKAKGKMDKVGMLKYRRVSRVNIYELDGYEDYFYGFMLPSTSYLKCFDVTLYDDGIVLVNPDKKNPTKVEPFNPPVKLFEIQSKNVEKCRGLQIDTVADLNELICSGKVNNLILINEALQEKQIADIAGKIVEKADRKFVMIAGPSSSGKTTFSNRLSIQLMAQGRNPHPIALDNYFVNREDTPLDEDGNYNFECLEALDIEQFNKDMTALLNGERVELPWFNFKTGKREYRGDFKQLGKDDILVIEGIHGLNDELSYSLPKESKYKVYISALTQINIDGHNRIAANTGRLIRRIVRDTRTRGTKAKETIAMWNSVRRGEENHIFPYQEEADVMFNSAMLYEIAVLKQYIEPQLYAITKDDPEYLEANKILKLLDYFLTIPSEAVPNNSILREFIGGSCFNV